MKKILLAILFTAATALGQAPSTQCTSSNLNAAYSDTQNNVQYLCTTAGWKAGVGMGAPTAVCTASNYGQPYTDVASNASYVCGGFGTWFSAAGTGGNGFPITLGTTQVFSGGTSVALNGLALTTTSVNGVSLTNSGLSTQFLNGLGGYTTPTGGGGGVSSINSTTGAFTFSFSGGAGSCSGTTCTFTGAGTGGGSVTNFIANAGSWPTWLVPTVSNSTTTPTLSVASSGFPFSALAGGTNTTAAMTVGAGASLNFASTGTINASALGNATFAAPGPIGSTTPSTGTFTTLAANGGISATSDGVNSGFMSLAGNTANHTVAANTAGLLGPNVASFTGYACQLPSTAPAGGQVLSCSTPVGGVSTGSWVNLVTGLGGDLTCSGSGAVNCAVGGLNGVALSSLSTGLLQNTNSTGVPTIANQINVTGSGAFGTYSSSGVYGVPCTNTPVFDLSQGDTQVLTIGPGCTAISSSSIINLPTGAQGRMVRIKVIQDATGGRPFPTPAWANGWVPITQTASGFTSQIFSATSSGLDADGYNSAFCALSGASPLACGNAYKGFVTIAAGTNPTESINTTAIGTNSIILLQIDNTIGASVVPAVSCNATIPSEIIVTVKVPNTGFVMEAVGTFTDNPVCVSYVVVNP